MVPLLLLLLLRESLADQVCLDISDHTISINGTDLDSLSELKNTVTCETDGFPCAFLCIPSREKDFSPSSLCLNATMTREPDRVVYNIHEYAVCARYLCDDTVLRLIESLDCDSSDQKNMTRLFYIRTSCAEFFTYNRTAKITYIDVERQMIHNIVGTTQFEDGDSVNSSLSALSLGVHNISESELSSAGASSSFHIEAPQLLPQNKSRVPDIWFPVSALETIPEEERIICLVSYMQHSQFQLDQEKILSAVVRIELKGARRLHNLTTPIKMIFRVTKPAHMDIYSQLLCHYLDETVWLWKPDGCTTTYNETHNGQINITCNCSHTTPFAVLLIRDPIAEAHWQILSIISYIGCGVSAVFTALSLVIYVFSRNNNMESSISIHVSLSGALFLLNCTFLLTEWGARVDLEWVCVLVAAFMHYSLLCCFTWMAIEGLHLYLLFIKVFNTYYRHYLLKLSLAGWGIPGVIVAVSVGVKDIKQLYGVTEVTMADTNQTNSICWITDDSFFYSLNLVYFTLIFVFNSGILMAVASSICRMKQAFRSNSKLGAETERFSASCRSGLTLLGLTCLMGTTWGLAFLGSGYVNYPILYLFCILNSTQGFFIFLWICLSAKKQRKRDVEDRMSSTPARTSGTKLD